MSVENDIFQMLSQFTSVAKTRVSARAIGTHMAGGSYMAPPFPPRSSVTGPLRILSRRLSSSLTGAAKAGQSTREGITEVVRKGKDRMILIFGSAVPYAAIHEYGFTGTMQVPEHTRTITQAFGKPISARQVTVSAHSKFAAIPARPYLKPAIDTEEDFLVSWLENELVKIIEVQR